MRRRMWTSAGVLTVAVGRWLWREATRLDLEGKGVLVTGGSRGLGLVLAREFAARGARLSLCARDAEELEQAKMDLQERGAFVHTAVCDITQPDQVKAWVDAAVEALGGVDVLVNNAGIITVGPQEEMTLQDYQEAMQVHFFGPLHAVNEVLPRMKALRRGRIVNIASIGGKVSVPHLLPYSASKFALVGYSEGLRAELLKDNVRVTTVCPGLMRTGSPRNASFKGHHETEYAWFKLADSLPPLAMSAERAARQVVDACERGEAEVTLSFAAKLAARVNGLFPSWVSAGMALVGQLLPGPGGVGARKVPGRESEGRLTRSVLTAASRVAAVRNNEV